MTWIAVACIVASLAAIMALGLYGRRLQVRSRPRIARDDDFAELHRLWGSLVALASAVAGGIGFVLGLALGSGDRTHEDR